jgi:hypothetical protein
MKPASGLKFRDPQTLEKKSGGGFLALFGLPFFAAGAFVILSVFGLVPMENEGGRAPWFLVFFGLPFLLIGLVLMLGRGGIVIDLRQNTVIKWWGLLAPIKRTYHELGTSKRVTLKEETRGSGKNRHTVYVVRLEPEAGESLELSAPPAYQSGRAEAETIAKFVNLPMIDYTSGAPVERAPEQLDESVRERARRTRENIKLPPQPYHLRAEVQDLGDSATIKLPSPGLSALQIPQVLIPTLFALFAGVVILPGILSTDEAEAIYLIGGMVSFFFVVLPLSVAGLAVLSQVRKRITVTVSHLSLKVEERGLFRTRITEIPAEELEGLTLTPAGNLKDVMSSVGTPVRSGLEGGPQGSPLAWSASSPALFPNP